MQIKTLFLRNCRNLVKKSFNLSNRTILTGRNGVGKTSVLESISLLLSAKSFRTRYARDIINYENEVLFVKGDIIDKSQYERNVSFGSNRQNEKKITIDGEISKRKELLQLCSFVVHTPEDIDIIKGYPAQRRDFFDKIALIENPEYFDTVVNYSRYVKHKTLMLKKGDLESVKYLNKGVVSYIKTIQERRIQLSQKIMTILNQILEDIFEDFTVSIFMPSNDDIEEKLFDKLLKEIEKGQLLYGPHLDNILIKVNSRKSKTVSMGELSFISILLKIAELKMHAEKNIKPIFLGDDIYAFLDNKRAEKVALLLHDLKNQIVLSSVSPLSGNLYKEIELSNQS